MGEGATAAVAAKTAPGRVRLGHVWTNLFPAIPFAIAISRLVVPADFARQSGTVSPPCLLAVLISAAVAHGVAARTTNSRLRRINHTVVTLESALRTLTLLGILIASLPHTRRVSRDGSDFDWSPCLEVAKRNFGISVTIVLAMA